MKISVMCFKKLRNLLFIVCLLGGVILSGCGSSGNSGSGDISSDGKLIIRNSGFTLEYNGNTALEWVPLNDEDMDEILALYQEVGNGSDYKDSLLIAEKYSGGRGVNTFVQENLDTLENQGLELNNIKKSQIQIIKDGKNINGVLAEYEIVEGFVDKIPKLYVSQLFVIQDENVILFSYITENNKSRNYAVEMFKNIK